MIPINELINESLLELELLHGAIDSLNLKFAITGSVDWLEWIRKQASYTNFKYLRTKYIFGVCKQSSLAADDKN